MMRKITFNIILVAGFAYLAIWIIRPFMADMYFDRAQKLVSGYQWPKAETEFEKAISIDRFNSRYPAELAGLFLRRASYEKGWIRINDLKKAEGLYKGALALNPHQAEYAIGMGQAQLSLFLETGESKYKKISFSDFRRALTSDPNGFNVSYQIGYAGVAVWKSLDDKEKVFILDRLKYSLKLKHWYSKYIYPRLWQSTGDFKLLQQATPENLRSNEDLYNFIVMNNLWEFRKEGKEALDYYKQKEGPENFEQERQQRLKEIEKIKVIASRRSKTSEVISHEAWHGRAFDGKNLFKNGDMPWSGTIRAAILVPSGNATIKIQAKGEPANGVYPYMIVQLDGEDIGETFVNSAEWKKYMFNVNTNGGIKVLSITFANDATNPKKNEDRNLFIGEAKIDK